MRKIRVNLTKYVSTEAGLRYCPAVITSNGRIKQNIVLVGGKEERHVSGAYYLDWRASGLRVRLSVGKNAQDALTQRDRKTFELNAANHGVVVQSEVQNGDGSNGDGHRSLAVAVTEYLADIKLNKKHKTHAAYSTALGYFLESCKKPHLEDIERRDMLKFSAFLRDEKKQAPRSVHNKFSNVLGFLRSQGITEKIVKKEDWPQYTEEETEVYEREDLNVLFAKCDPEERLWFEFFLQTGMREQEVMYCCWKDVNLTAATVRVSHKPEYGWTPKAYRERTIPVPDDMNRLTQAGANYAFSSLGNLTVGYGYDAASNRTSMTDPQNLGTAYTYDTLNRLSTLAFNGQTPAFSFGYDALSRRTSLTRPNSVDTTYAYDPISRLTSILHKLGTTTLDGATYTYDAAGNRLTRTDKRLNTTLTYGYDNIYQLLSAKQGSTTKETYTYDAVGNRLSSLGVSPYIYNSSNELTALPSGSYTYDNNGNTKTKPDGTQYTWDFENRLTQVVLPGTGGTVNFKYDPFGRRIQKAFTQNGTTTTTNYVYDSANILEALDNNGNVLSRYTQGQGIDEPLAELISGTTSYYEQDGLGSITSLSSSAGALANTYSYDSYGKLTASTGSVANPFKYTGREFDSETGNYFYRARHYDPAVGRFVSEDPIGFKGGINFYRYALNSPIVLRDPSGLTVTCYYGQNTGQLICYDDTSGNQVVNVTGYAGGDKGKSPGCVNDSECQDSENEGPLPWGDYSIGPDNGHMGPLSLPLTPLPGTPTYDRPGRYYLHGCRRKGPVCSEGCIVVPPDARGAINNSGGGLIMVAPTADPPPTNACQNGVCRI